MKKSNITSWILYDFGMAQYSMVIITAYFIIYFKQVVVGNIGGTGDLLWGISSSIAMALAVILSPLFGTYSDISKRRKQLFIIFSLISILSTVLLYFSDRGTVTYSMIFFILSYACYSINITFYNSFLPDIVKRGDIEKYSGIGWGLGYLGGLASLVLMIFIVKGLEDSKTVILITAISYLLFAFPSYIFLPRQRAKMSSPVSILSGFYEIKSTFMNIRQYKKIFIFLIAYFFISDGISTVIVFFSSYTVHTLKFTLKENFILLMLIQIFAAIGAISTGYLAKRFGLIRSIKLTVIIWILSIGIIFITENKNLFFIISTTCGTVLGGTQALARSYIAISAPPEKSGEFFGFMTFSSKIAAIFGPLIFGAVSKITESQRYSILSLELLFLIGLIILLKIDDHHPSHCEST